MTGFKYHGVWFSTAAAAKRSPEQFTARFWHVWPNATAEQRTAWLLQAHQLLLHAHRV